MIKRKQGLTKASALLPGFESLTPVLQEIEQSKAPTVQGRHHFTRFKQLDALADIGDGGSPDMGFMTRLLTLCSLPRTDHGNRLQYKRQNGPYKLAMIAGVDNKLPYGNLPRLLLAWVCTEARPHQRSASESRYLACRFHAAARYTQRQRREQGRPHAP